MEDAVIFEGQLMAGEDLFDLAIDEMWECNALYHGVRMIHEIDPTLTKTTAPMLASRLERVDAMIKAVSQSHYIMDHPERVRDMQSLRTEIERAVTRMVYVGEISAHIQPTTEDECEQPSTD